MKESLKLFGGIWLGVVIISMAMWLKNQNEAKVIAVPQTQQETTVEVATVPEAALVVVTNQPPVTNQSNAGAEAQLNKFGLSLKTAAPISVK